MFGGHAFGDTSFGEKRAPLYIRISVSVSIAINFDYRIHVATQELITTDDDLPSLQPFDADLDEALDFTWSLMNGGRFGGFVNGKGSTIINNLEGRRDTLTQRYTTTGHPVEVRLGRKGDLMKTWPIVFKGMSSGEFIDDSAFEITIEDLGYMLDVPAQSNVYLGTGGLNGTADLKGKPLPLAYGWPNNFEPPLVIPNENLFQVNDGRVQAIAVFDNGEALTFHADYATVALLRAATFPAGRFGTCLAQGYFCIINDVTNEPGTITCSVQGDVTGGVFAQTTVKIVRALLNRSTDLNDPADLYAPSFTVLDALQPAPVGIYIGHNENPTVAEVVNKLMLGIGGFAGFRREGTFHVGRIDIPVGPPVKRFDKYNFDPNPRKEKLPDGAYPPPAKWLVGYARNYTVQTDIAGVVTQDRRAFLAEEYRYAVAEDARIKTDFPFGKEQAPVEAFFRDEADAQAEATRLLALFRSRGLYRFGVDHRDAALLNVGLQVFAKHDRGDLVVGKNAVLVDLHHKASTKSAELLVLA